MISLKEAQELILKEAKSFGTEIVSLDEAYGRVLSSTIYADRNYPPFNRSAVDGYAIRSIDADTTHQFEIIEELHAGAVATQYLRYGTAIKIMTGAPVPSSADAVVKVEETTIQEGKMHIGNIAIKRGMNIAQEGEDKKNGELAIESDTLCTPQVIGILASLGMTQIPVHRKPTVSIISTGNEIKSPYEKVLPHQIRDANSPTLAAFFKQHDIEVTNTQIVPDNKELLAELLSKSLCSDIIIVSGGVSMGDADFIPEVLTELGVKKIFHKVAIKPGKPIWFGKTPDNTIVFALPGNPFSCQVAFKIFIEPYIRACYKLSPLRKFLFPLTEMKKKKTQFDELFPICFNENGTEIMPVKFNGSGDFCSVVYSHGIGIHPATKNELAESELVEVYLWN